MLDRASTPYSWRGRLLCMRSPEGSNPRYAAAGSLANRVVEAQLIGLGCRKDLPQSAIRHFGAHRPGLIIRTTPALSTNTEVGRQ
jgi:hypothetical protein